MCEFYGATEGNGTVVNVCSARAARGAVGRQGALLRAVRRGAGCLGIAWQYAFVLGMFGFGLGSVWGSFGVRMMC